MVKRRGLLHLEKRGWGGIYFSLRYAILFLRRILKSPKTVIHVNLCVALLTGNILLLIGSVSTEYKVPESSAIHYLLNDEFSLA